MTSGAPNENPKTTKTPAHHSGTGGAPSWAKQPFKDFVDYVHRLQHLLRICVRGIGFLPNHPELIEALADLDDELHESSTKERIREAKIESKLADREIHEGFPILHALATVALWGALENVVRLFVARWLANFPDALQAESVQRLRVRIGEYESLQGEDRFFYIVDQLERELSSPLRSGVTRFETLLKEFDLSGAIPDFVRRILFELNQVRNVLVHRGARADLRFIEACPWLGYSIGDPVTITADDFHMYSRSVEAYLIELIARVGDRFGIDMSKQHAHAVNLSMELEKLQKRRPLSANQSPERDMPDSKKDS